MEIDILQYKPVIAAVLARFNLPAKDREDLAQECYLALLEKQDHLAAGIQKGTGDQYASTICRTRVIDILRSQAKTVKADSLTEPRTKHKADKVAAPTKTKGPATEVHDAICSLSPKEAGVIYEHFVEGKTDVESAKEHGVRPRTLRYQRMKAVEKLKKYFEVEDGRI